MRNLLLSAAPRGAAREYTDLSRPSATEVGRLFGEACRRGEIETGRSYRFDQETRSFHAESGKLRGNPSYETRNDATPRGNAGRLTIDDARPARRAA